MKLLLSLAVLFSLPLPAAATQSEEFEFLKKLVSISSGTADSEGVNEVQNQVAEKLRSLGFSVELISNPNKKINSGKLLVGTLKGKDPRYITFIAHADTVFEKLNPFVVSEDGKIARGSGVSDNKGGIVVGVSAIERFLKKGAPRFSLRFIVSASEEIGSEGFESTLKSFSSDSTFVIALEPARENGNVVIARKGSRWYEIKVTGKEAHAGVDHDSGINACSEIARISYALQSLTNYKNGTTVSIGRLEGGKNKFNIVCGSAVAKIDLRYETLVEGKKVMDKIDQILKTPITRSAKTGELAKIEVSSSAYTPPFEAEKATTPLLKKYFASIKRIEGISIQAEKTGGVGDINSMSIPGLRAIDGMGPIGGGYHTADEYVQIPSLVTRSEALAELLEEIK